MKQNNPYTDLMGELQTHYEQNKIDVFIPSLGTFSAFTPISVKQHKNILKTDNNLLQAGLQFNININKIILDNSPVDNILLTDRVAILLALKDTPEDRNLSLIIDNVQHEVDIKSHVDTFASIDFNKNLTTTTLNFDKFTIHCSIPTLSKDILINEKVKARLQSSKTSSLPDSVGDLFIYEMIKYIDRIESDSIKLDLNEFTFDQQISVCEMIPMSLSDKIIQYVNSTRETEVPYIKCKNTKGEYIQLPLSATLFAGD